MAGYQHADVTGYQLEHCSLQSACFAHVSPGRDTYNGYIRHFVLAGTVEPQPPARAGAFGGQRTREKRYVIGPGYALGA
jgi:hypothetical protein